MNANLSGYTALSPRDVSDARRGRPAVDLSWYAAERGLQALGNSTAEGYIAAMPGEETLQFNVMRGVLPGGAYGVLFHHRVAWRREVGVPCTQAAALVPEAALQDFSITDRTSPLGHRERLAYRGLHGWHLAADRAPEPGLVERLLAGPLLRALQATAVQRPYFELIVRRGALSVRTNGYLNDPDELDWLATVLSIAASELREACLAVAEPRPFDQPLPPARWSQTGDPWRSSALELAAAYGMTLEDERAYHRAFPSLPVPGTAFAVMRGPIPGTSLTGRVALHGEGLPAGGDVGRNAVLLPVCEEMTATPPRGVFVPDHGLGCAARHGVLAVFHRRDPTRWAPLGDVAALVDRAIGLARALKLV
jgi:hypothetical protein